METKPVMMRLVIKGDYHATWTALDRRDLLEPADAGEISPMKDATVWEVNETAYNATGGDLYDIVTSWYVESQPETAPYKPGTLMYWHYVK